VAIDAIIISAPERMTFDPFTYSGAQLNEQFRVSSAD